MTSSRAWALGLITIFSAYIVTETFVQKLNFFADFTDWSTVNPGIPGVCDWDRDRIARSGRSLGEDNP